MAKRAAPEEREYRPVQESVLRSVLNRSRPREEAAAQGGNTMAVVEDGNAVAMVEVEEAPPTPLAPLVAPGAPAEDENPKAPSRQRAAKATKGEDTGEAEEQPNGKSERPSNRKTLVREKRMLLSLEEEEELEALVREISRGLGVRVKTSNVLRACVALLFNVQDELSKQCQRTKFTKRPRYNEPTSITNFEENIARLLDTAVRNTKSFDG